MHLIEKNKQTNKQTKNTKENLRHDSELNSSHPTLSWLAQGLRDLIQGSKYLKWKF